MQGSHYARFFLVALSLLALFLGVPLAVELSSSGAVYLSADEVPPADTAILPGASVYKGKPSPVLAARADEAIELWTKAKVKNILVTGDGTERFYDEVTPVRDYLEAGGVPAGSIMIDREGLDTFKSMYRARSVFGVTAGTIVTQDFHMPRALFLARGVGMRAVGAIAPGGESAVFEYAREIPADWKALFDIAALRWRELIGARL